MDKYGDVDNFDTTIKTEVKEEDPQQDQDIAHQNGKHGEELKDSELDDAAYNGTPQKPKSKRIRKHDSSKIHHDPTRKKLQNKYL